MRDPAEPRPITLQRATLGQAHVRADRRRYRGSGRPLSVRRLLGLLRVNLSGVVFVIGADRSGTTFLGESLAALPESHLGQPWLLAASLTSVKRDPTGYRYGPDARFWVEPERREEFETTNDLRRTIWSWRRHTEAALEGRSLPAERYHELRYEQLVTQPAVQGERLLDFLGIGARPSRGALLGAPSAADSGSVGRWRAELSADQLELIEAEAGPLLRELDYG